MKKRKDKTKSKKNETKKGIIVIQEKGVFKGFRKIGLGLIILGFFIIIIQPFTSVTGAVIDISSDFGKVWFFIGLGLVVGGVVVFVALKEKPLESLLSNIGSIPEEVPYSVQEASLSGIPLKEARKIWRDANEQVKTGYWVPLDIIRVASARNQEDYPDATTLIRYWGPKEYEKSSRKKLDRLFKAGILGKTHELIRGSDIYPQKDLKTGRLKDNKTTIPKKGSRVLHRHWEVGQMHDYKNNPREDIEKII